MSNQNAGSSKFSNIFAGAIILIALITGILVYKFILGDSSHFEGGDNTKHPISGDYLGMMYKGGPLVPILMAAFIIVLATILERFFTLSVASGKGSIPTFVQKLTAFSTTIRLILPSQNAISKRVLLRT